jgi:hypothetical protein
MSGTRERTRRSTRRKTRSRTGERKRRLTTRRGNEEK